MDGVTWKLSDAIYSKTMERMRCVVNSWLQQGGGRVMVFVVSE